MNNLINKIYNDIEFITIIDDILNNKTVIEMKNFRQHYSTSCFDHCLIASYYCYKICKKLDLDYISCVRAAMLHDLFLYNWRERQPDRKGLHAFTHPYTAYENASNLFNLNSIEKDVIIKHMWPLTIYLPKYKESYILTLVDKYCAITESYNDIYNSFCQKKLFRYSYILLSLIFLYF